MHSRIFWNFLIRWSILNSKIRIMIQLTKPIKVFFLCLKKDAKLFVVTQQSYFDLMFSVLSTSNLCYSKLCKNLEHQNSCFKKLKKYLSVVSFNNRILFTNKLLKFYFIIAQDLMFGYFLSIYLSSTIRSK